MIDIQEAKRELEKAAQQHEKHKTYNTSSKLDKARIDYQEARIFQMRAQIKNMQAKIDQLQATLRIRSREGMEERGFVSIGELAGKIAYDLQDNIPPYGKPMTAKQKAEALFKGAAE